MNRRHFVQLTASSFVALRTGVAEEKTEPNWKPLFDGKTLANWKPTEFSGHGEVSVEDGRIILDQGNDLTGVNYTGAIPRTNYEVALEAMRLVGGDFFCGLTLPVAAACCTLVVGGWGGSLVGISSINGDDASDNETMQTRKFEANRWYKIRVRVTPERLDAWIDEGQIVKLELAGKKISMRRGEIEASQPFGIATFRTRAALREVKLRELA